MPDPRNEDSFKRFWELYPRKVNKKHARFLFDIAINVDKVDPEAIFDGAARYAAVLAANHTASKYIKYPDGWLQDERWSDELENPIVEKLQTSKNPMADLVREKMRQDRLKAIQAMLPLQSPSTKVIQ